MNAKRKGQRVGYVRVSTLDQNTARQLEGTDVDRVFTDKASGKDTKRPQLEAALNYVREGDTLVVHSMDRLARNVRDLLAVVENLNGQGIAVEFVSNGMTFTGDDSPMSRLMLSVLGAVGEFERALILERQREGIAIAKQIPGKYRGRKPSLSEEQSAELVRRAEAGEAVASLAREFGISRETAYQRIRSATGTPKAPGNPRVAQKPPKRS